MKQTVIIFMIELVLPAVVNSIFVNMLDSVSPFSVVLSKFILSVFKLAVFRSATSFLLDFVIASSFSYSLDGV